MRIIKTIFDILTFPIRMLYPGFSAAVFTCFEILEDVWADEYCEPASDKKVSP